MSKKFLTQTDRLESLKKRSELIKESFKGEFNKIKRLDETQYNEEGSIEIKPARETRNGSQMFHVYYNGDAIYEFGENSFRDMEPKKIALQLFDTYNISQYRMTYDTAIKIVGEMLNTLKRGAKQETKTVYGELDNLNNIK